MKLFDSRCCLYFNAYNAKDSTYFAKTIFIFKVKSVLTQHATVTIIQVAVESAKWLQQIMLVTVSIKVHGPAMEWLSNVEIKTMKSVKILINHSELVCWVMEIVRAIQKVIVTAITIQEAVLFLNQQLRHQHADAVIEELGHARGI